MREITIIDKVLSERYWRLTTTSVKKSGHRYLNSPYHMDDTCDCCDEVNCATCKDIIIDPYLECCIPVDIYAQMLVESGIDAELARHLVMNNKHPEYTLVDPNEYILKRDYPEVYQKLITIDPEIEREIHDCVLNDAPITFGDVKYKVIRNHGVPTIPNSSIPLPLTSKLMNDEMVHICYQLQLWWAMKNNCNWTDIKDEIINRRYSKR